MTMGLIRRPLSKCKGKSTINWWALCQGLKMKSSFYKLFHIRCSEKNKCFSLDQLCGLFKNRISGTERKTKVYLSRYIINMKIYFYVFFLLYVRDYSMTTFCSTEVYRIGYWNPHSMQQIPTKHTFISRV